MPETARRTLAKVKSSAITPRQPEVPNLMGEVVMTAYSNLSRPFSIYEAACRDDRAKDSGHEGGTMSPSANAIGEARIVLVTVESLTEARRIAKSLVKKKLAACVNILLSPVS